MVKDGAALLGRELSLDVTEPARPQRHDAARDLVDVLGGVSFQSLRRFHFKHDDLNPIAASARLPVVKKSPSGAGGLELGLLIFETKLHPATVDITIDHRIRFLQSPQRLIG
jgi:hypothetical protein